MLLLLLLLLLPLLLLLELFDPPVELFVLCLQLEVFPPEANMLITRGHERPRQCLDSIRHQTQEKDERTSSHGPIKTKIFNAIGRRRSSYGP